MAEIVHPRFLSACASTSSPVENMGWGLPPLVGIRTASLGGAPPDWWTIEAQTVPGGWGVSVIESGESYVILNTLAPWYRAKAQPSVLDILVKLRRVIIVAQYRWVHPEPVTPQEISVIRLAWEGVAV